MAPLPKPRNAYEQQAQRKTRGAKAQGDALTVLTADLVRYLMQHVGMSQRSALRRAAEAVRSIELTDSTRKKRAASLMASREKPDRWQVPVSEANVRRYLREGRARAAVLRFVRDATPEELAALGLPVALRPRAPPISR